MKIVKYLEEYDVGGIADFFLYNLGVFLYPFEERFKPIWEQIVLEWGEEYTTRITEGECDMYTEFGELERKLWGKIV